MKLYDGQKAVYYPVQQKSITDYNLYEGVPIHPGRFYQTTKTIIEDKNKNESKISEEIIEKNILSKRLVIQRKTNTIPIEFLKKCPDGWNPYPKYEEEKYLEMCESILEHGVFYPLIVLKRSDTYYEILDGYERANAQKGIYDETKDPKFKTMECMVIQKDEINDLLARSIILDANFSKHCNKVTILKVILMKIGIEQELKKRKNDLNIAKKIANDLKLSVSVVHQYIKLQKCLPEILHILDIGQINLTSARKISTYKPEVQERIIEKVGLFDLRNELIKSLPDEFDLKNVDKVIEHRKSVQHPSKAKIFMDGPYDLIMEIGYEIQKLLVNIRYKRVKFKYKNQFFKFMTGFIENNTRQRSLPEYYMNLIDKDIDCDFTIDLNKNGSPIRKRMKKKKTQENMKSEDTNIEKINIENTNIENINECPKEKQKVETRTINLYNKEIHGDINKITTTKSDVHEDFTEIYDTPIDDKSTLEKKEEDISIKIKKIAESIHFDMEKITGLDEETKYKIIEQMLRSQKDQ